MVSFYVLDVSILDDDKLFSKKLNQVSDFRKKKVDAFRFRKDKNLCLGAGILLDLILEKSGLRESEMTYSVTPYGKPFFTDYPNLHFSISHSGHYSAVAFSNKEVGCDIEEIIGLEESFMKNFKVENESEFFDLWCTREAYLKAKGIGLSNGISYISPDSIKKEFELQLFDFPKGYKTAVCHKDTGTVIKPNLLNLNNYGDYIYG